jgi:hypothetical protein
MAWALRNRRAIRQAILVVATAMILANLSFGPTPFVDRLVLVAVSIGMAPFSYYGMRWVLQFQIWQHGLRPWIRQFAAGSFYFFGIASVISIPISFAPSAFSPWAGAFIMFATTAYSALITIARAEEQQRAIAAS